MADPPTLDISRAHTCMCGHHWGPTVDKTGQDVGEHQPKCGEKGPTVQFAVATPTGIKVVDQATGAAALDLGGVNIQLDVQGPTFGVRLPGERGIHIVRTTSYAGKMRPQDWAGMVEAAPRIKKKLPPVDFKAEDCRSRLSERSDRLKELLSSACEERGMRPPSYKSQMVTGENCTMFEIQVPSDDEMVFLHWSGEGDDRFERTPFEGHGRHVLHWLPYTTAAGVTVSLLDWGDVPH